MMLLMNSITIIYLILVLHNTPYNFRAFTVRKNMISCVTYCVCIKLSDSGTGFILLRARADTVQEKWAQVQGRKSSLCALSLTFKAQYAQTKQPT